ncbi:vitellogenin-A2-like isoform X2 [Lissotriton helveticus]
MRGIILAAFLALVRSEPHNVEPVFSESKTYVFQYEAIILNGLPEAGLARSGVKLNCKVEISGLSHKVYLLKMISPEIKEYNGIWPKDPFTRSSKLTQDLAAQLSTPVKYEYNHGQVGAIYAPVDVSETILNIYRGIVNLLQVTIKNKHIVYDLQEEGISGVCHTRYVIHNDKRSGQLIIVKSTDLNNCQDKVVQNLGMAYVEIHPSLKKNVKNIRGATTYTYEMKHTDSGPLITEVTARQVYQFSPFNELYGAAVMEARQVLSWLETRSNRVNTPQTHLQNRGGLRYNFATELHQIPIQLAKTRSTEAQIAETLQHLVQNNQKRVHQDAPAAFIKLVQILRTSDFTTIQSMWRRFADKPQHRRWLLNVIPVAGTIDTLRFVKQNIHNQEFSHHEEIQAAGIALHFTKADHHTMQLATEMVKDAKIREARALHKVTLLAYGAMVNKYCSSSPTCPEDVLMPLHDLAAEAAIRGHEEDMALALKAMGNAGQPVSVKRIQKFLPGFSTSASQLPVRVQTDAVMALRNIAKVDPRRVQEILLQIFMDRRVPSEVRMMACVVLFESRPDLALITTIANVVEKESKVNLQLASFTYSHMKAMSKSRVPHLHQMAADCSIALKILNPKLDALGFRYSKAIHFDMFQDSLLVGASANAFVLNSASTRIPVFMLSKIRGFLAGAEADILEVALRAEGLEQTLRKQNIPFAEFPMYKKIVQIAKTLLGWKALPSEVPLISAYFKLFGQEFDCFELDKKTIQNFMKAMTEPAERHTLVKNVINKLLNGFVGQQAQPVLAAEVRHIAPTCVGLPMELSLYSAAVANAAFNANMKIIPLPPADFGPAHLLESKIHLDIELIPSISMHTVATMGINTHLIQAGIEFHAKLHTLVPLQFTAKIDLKAKNVKFETTPCQQENEIFVTRTQVFAITRNMDELEISKRTPLLPRVAFPNILKEPFKTSETSSAEAASMMDASSELVVTKYAYSAQETNHRLAPHNPSTFNECAKSTNYGFQICLDLKSHNAAFLKNSALYKVIGEHEATFVMKPVHTDAVVENLFLEVQIGAKAASKIIHLSNLNVKEETPQDSVIQMKLKKLLGLDDDYYQPFFIGGKSSPGLVITAQAVRNDNKNQGHQVIVYTDYHASKPQIQAYVVELTSSSRWRACADAAIVNHHEAEVYLRWGLSCQDYKIAVKAETGLFDSQPGMRLKVEWPRIPPPLKSAGKFAFQYIPGAALMAGFSEKMQENPSRQANVILSLSSPRHMDVFIQTPKVTLFYRSILLPVAIAAGRSIQESGIQAPTWNVFSEAPNFLIDKLKEPFVMITKEGAGLSLIAPDYGIEKLYYDGITCTVVTALWMKGKTCGICGRHDDVKEQEFQMPDGSVAKNEQSFAHSWISEEGSCSGACKLRRSIVKLGKPLGVDGEDANCYSVEPVLQCVKGCSVTQSSRISVGFHCLGANSSTTLAEGQGRLDMREDFSDIIDAHTACSCAASSCSA